MEIFASLQIKANDKVIKDIQKEFRNSGYELSFVDIGDNQYAVTIEKEGVDFTDKKVINDIEVRLLKPDSVKDIDVDTIEEDFATYIVYA